MFAAKENVFIEEIKVLLMLQKFTALSILYNFFSTVRTSWNFSFRKKRLHLVEKPTFV